MIIEILSKVDTVAHDFVFGGYQGLVSAYKPAIFGLVSLSAIIFGYGILHGWVEMTLAEIGKKALIIGFVLMFALNWSSFSNYVYNFFTKAPNEIATNLLKTLPNSSFTDATGANNALDKAWDQGMQTTAALYKQAGITKLAPLILCSILFILVCMFVGLALLELVVAKMGLAIFLVLAPIVIPLFLFKVTKEAVFDGWFKQLLTFALIPIFVMTSLALGLMLMASYSNNLADLAAGKGSISISDIAPFVLCIIVTIGLLLKSASMAAAIANGFATGAAGHFGAAGAVAGALALNGARKAREYGGKFFTSDKARQHHSTETSHNNSNVNNDTQQL